LGLARPKSFAIERLWWTGKVPFESRRCGEADGFELTFTSRSTR